jgi:hypothetical protein
MLVVFIFLPLFVLGLFTFYLFDRVVKLEYNEYKKYWEMDGKPIGFFWIPKESESKFLGIPALTSSVARSRLCMKWIFLTPTWTLGDEKASRLILHYRIFTALLFLGSLTWGGIVLFGTSMFR